MAFWDEPIVDENAKKSEESVNAVKSLLTRRRGFISRIEEPDYGVDLNVELMDQSGATSQMFPVQIKSTAKVVLVERDGKAFAPLVFKTSRLGYLCRRAPVSGIIVLYDDATATCYFDYVEDIVARLNAQHGERDWWPQETVTIQLLAQPLDPTALLTLHQKFTQAHHRHQLLLLSYGGRYDLTAVVPTASGKPPFDANDPQQVAAFLEEFSGLLHNQQEFSLLLDLFGRLPTPRISASKTLLFFAALTYVQAGNTIEGEYFLNKCFRRREEFDAASLELLEFAHIRVDFIKGENSPSAYLDKLTTLQASTHSPLNKLTFEINSIHIRLVEAFDGSTIPDAAVITDLFPAIEAAPIAEKDKQLLKLFNSENLHTYGCEQLLKVVSQFKISDKFGVPITPAIRLERAQAISALVTQAIKVVESVADYAKTENDRLLNAHALLYSSRFFFSLHYCLMMIHFDEPVALTAVLHTQYNRKYNASGEAHSLFQGLGLFKEAHQALSTAYELQTLFQLRYTSQLSPQPADELLQALRTLEKENGFPAFESAVRPAHEGMSGQLVRPPSKLTDIPEGQIQVVAKKYLELVDLPADRLPFLVADIQAFQLFAQECENEEVEMLADNDHLRDSRTAYAQPVSYRLRHKVTDFQTPLSNDVPQLLSAFKHLVKKSS